MIEDMHIHGMGDKAQKAHIRAVKDLAKILKRSRDTATPDDLRAYQLHMSYVGVMPPTYNALIMALRFLFGKTCVSGVCIPRGLLLDRFSKFQRALLHKSCEGFIY